MKEQTKINLLFLCILSLGIVLGIASTLYYQSYQQERFLNGMYIYEAESQFEAMQIANKGDNGDWVCINVAYDMTPKEAYDTCIHECTHKAFSEIYAESCENNITKCLNDLE